MAKYKFGNDKLSIEVDSDLEDLVQRIHGKSAFVIADALDKTLESIFENALEWWPVKTGRSKRGLNKEVVFSEDSIRGTIGNTVDYVYYIKGNNQAGKSTWQELIRKPMRKEAKKIANELSEEILALAEGKK